MGSSRPPPRTQDFFPAPALSLSLAGAFGGNEPPAAAGGDEVEDGDEGGGGIRSGLRLRAGEVVEISSENTGPAGSQSGGSWPAGDNEAADGGGGGGGDNKRRRKSYHRHTAQQIRVMEAVFKESPHPDEQQRQQLSQQLGLSARQVKFWFQNRRTQIKAVEERHENLLLKSELEKLQEENRAMRELAKKPPLCPNCGFAAADAGTEENQLRLEITRLKAEIERLRRALGSDDAGASSTSPSSCSALAIQTSNMMTSLGYDKTRMLELAGRALDELTTMCSSGEPLWVCSVETGRDVLHYDEYARLFRHDDGDSGDRRATRAVEASRETGVVYIEATQLVNAFIDVNQWKEMFPSMVARASTLGVIHAGDDHHRDGIVQTMFAEVQALTPLVPTREFRFVRHCKRLHADKWAIVDVSFDDSEQEGQTSSTGCLWLRKPSGCIVEEQTNGRCKVTWVEHATCRQAAVPSMSRRAATASGAAFGARRWVAALQLQCERRVFSVATNIPSGPAAGAGVATPAGRRSVLKLAHRMTSTLCRVLGGSRDLAWSNHGGGGQGIRVMSRKSTGEPGEPQGLIACAVVSSWLPVHPAAIFDFLRDDSRRHEWDVMLPGPGEVQSYASVAKGKDHRGNSVTAYAKRSSPERAQNGKWILQDSSSSPCEWILAYAPIDAALLRPVIDGHDSSGVPVLPSGLAVTPDGLEAKPAVIPSREEDARAAAAGSLVTVAFQALASSSATEGARLPTGAVETVTRVASCTLGRIKSALRCGEDC